MWELCLIETQLFEAQKMLKDDLEAVKRHLFAQAKNEEQLTDGCQSSLHSEEREQEITALRSAIVELQEQVRILLVSKNMPTRVRERRRRQRKLARRVLAAGSTTGESEDSDIGRAFGLAPESEGLSSSAEDMNRAGWQQP
ncbi:UNVERIFIED_CONTAM: hypothetical protein FKN15_041931 [Acipenser sinensis]